jgi:hypothetical protein
MGMMLLAKREGCRRAPSPAATRKGPELNPQEALNSIKCGNIRFAGGHPQAPCRAGDRRREMLTGQQPIAAILGARHDLEKFKVPIFEEKHLYKIDSRRLFENSNPVGAGLRVCLISLCSGGSAKQR